MSTAAGAWGKIYGPSDRPAYVLPDGRRVIMRRKGQRVRFIDMATSEQVGPEQRNVAPAAAYALSHGWRSPALDPGPELAAEPLPEPEPPKDLKEFLKTARETLELDEPHEDEEPTKEVLDELRRWKAAKTELNEAGAVSADSTVDTPKEIAQAVKNMASLGETFHRLKEALNLTCADEDVEAEILKLLADAEEGALALRTIEQLGINPSWLSMVENLADPAETLVRWAEGRP